MSDRALLFLGSVLMVIISLACSVWLVVTGQAVRLDGLFMMLVCLLTALVFALYVWFMIGRAREELEKEAKAK